MRMLMRLLLVLLMLAGMADCLVCGWGIVQNTFATATVAPAWLPMPTDVEGLIRGSYWGVLAVSLSALTLAALDRWQNVEHEAAGSESLVGTPISTPDEDNSPQSAYLQSLLRAVRPPRAPARSKPQRRVPDSGQSFSDR